MTSFKKLILMTALVVTVAQQSFADERMLVTKPMTADQYAAFLFQSPAKAPVAPKIRTRGLVVLEQPPAPVAVAQPVVAPQPAAPAPAPTPVAVQPQPQPAPAPVAEQPAPAPAAQPAPPPPPPAPAAAPAPTTRIIAVPVNFTNNSVAIPAEFKPQLIELAEAMQRPEAVGKMLVVTGHTDSKGSASYNMVLSMRRAASVEEFLVARGVPSDQVMSRGKGMTQPLPGKSGSDSLNRRVEFSVTSY